MLTMGTMSDNISTFKKTGPRFTIGRDHHGWWVVHDRAGQVGGLFATEDAALRFAASECDHHMNEICRAPASVTVELGRFTSDHIRAPAA
ncbi:hypothetical protein GOZ84_26015 [Agrobacterium vitis]|nr:MULTISPECIES: hypothetical protein [Rhizobium/Agrobacterium group]MCF1471782.1 hypothetical protein [Allorhizobium ampelinum]MVA54203.1 hypothetical protein [Agrobacterium vitis]NSZ55036.1 hypothetical protein [Agrobacterium vitis]NTA34028.1 hypothetical protein [Agrobacterium vitis]